MSFWERSNDLGRLEVLEVYEYYDQPVLLTCRSASDALFLVVAVEADNDSEHWLSVAISQRRFESVRSGKVDLRTAFSEPEDGAVLHFTVPRDPDSPVSLHRMNPSELQEEWLPAVGARLSLPTETLPKIAQDIQKHADQIHRYMLGINLDVIGALKNEVPAGVIGRVLEAVQETVTAFAQLIQPKTRTKKDSVAAVPFELMLVGVGGGSFEVRLASSEQAALFDMTASPITAATQQFGELLKLAADEPAFRAHAAGLKLHIASEYLSFLRAIEDRVTKAAVEWASPGDPKHYGRVIIQNQDIKASINAMIDLKEVERTFEVVGHLVMGHVEKKTYEFLADEPEDGIERFSGKVINRALDSATFGERYRATIEESRNLKPAGGIEVKHVLTKLQPVP